jgi:hypothetical protein
LKKFAAIALCTLLLFNWIGYRCWISFLQDEATVQMESRLDQNNFDKSQLISIKVQTSHLDSYANASGYERINGEVEIRGVLYKYVAKRLLNDTLEFLCIQDQAGMKLQSAKNEFFTVVNDLKQCGPEKKADHHTANSRFFSLDYFTVADLYTFHGLSDLTPAGSGHLLANLSDTPPLGLEQPPETVS